MLRYTNEMIELINKKKNQIKEINLISKLKI